jgi:hypothetical protein
MTRRKPSPAVQLARDVLHHARCPVPTACDQCNRLVRREMLDVSATLARALLRAVRT